MYYRNLIWTLDFRNRLWSNHPTEMIVRRDYVILYWESIPGFTQGVKPTSVVITQQCNSSDGSKLFTFSITDKNTTRRGSSGNRRTVRRPRKLSSTSRVIKFVPLPDSDNDGEFFHIPRGSSQLQPICGSGLFWQYFRWWITPVDDTIISGYARYLPQLYGFSFPNTLYGDPILCNIDEHFECVDVCLIDPSPSEIKTRFGYGDNIVIRKKLPPIPNKTEVSKNSLASSNPNLFYQDVKDQLTLFYGPHTLKISDPVGDSRRSSVFITVIGNAEFTWYDANGNETDDPSLICTYHYDHTPIFRVDAYKCVPNEPSDCDGKDPGWYLKICIEWDDPTSDTTNSLCNDYFLFPPLGLPFEGADWQVELANSLLAFIVDKVNQLIRDVLQGVVLTLPPNYRIIGRFILFVYDLLNIRVGAYFFFCPDKSNQSLPQCGDSYIITTSPI